MKEAHYGALEPDVMQLERRRYAGGTGSYPLVGTPEQIADEMIAMHKLGLAGVTPEEQQIATGAVLVATLIVFSSSGFIMRIRETFLRSHADASANS